MKLEFDLSLYLVTDSTMVPAGKTLVETVDQAIQGGVTIVQLREKSADTGDFIATARTVQSITRKASVPLLINDRIDVALAIDADGVHIGQDDMPLSEARRLLGPHKIIGVSVQTCEEAEIAVRGGADYLGIGTCYSTNTKAVKVGPQGPAGIRAVWEHALKVSEPPCKVRAVTIGGVNQYNVAHVLNYACAVNGTCLDGVAIVSAIMAAPDPRLAAQGLQQQISTARQTSGLRPKYDIDHVSQQVAAVFAQSKAGSITPLVQHITNSVVINDCANACLALGGSPIMAADVEEQADLAQVVNALVINIGTLATEQVAGMREAMRHANLHQTPIILDPVAVGATTHRMKVIDEMIRDFGICVIKGNAGEIAALAGSAEMKMRGVDAVGTGFADPVAVVKQVALCHRCVVVMTGVVDYVSDGTNTFAVRNGHKLQSVITGSGCMVGTVLGTFIHSVAKEAPVIGALTGILAINIAAEIAANRSDVQGPGTFRAAFIDSMHNLTTEQFNAHTNFSIL
ncbi:thiamine biosynthetic bifunctional enzyme [Coemansia sp. RSA 1878]|nr:thiamine biosynthetic bifunctional enzyme [Coemansia sp. RSA 1878]